MKRGILHALFCGNINPSARQIRAHSEYSRLCRELMDAENALRNILTKEVNDHEKNSQNRRCAGSADQKA